MYPSMTIDKFYRNKLPFLCETGDQVGWPVAILISKFIMHTLPWTLIPWGATPQNKHIDTKKMKNFQPCASKAGALLSWPFDNICEHAGRCQKALTVGFYRGKKTLIRMCCSFCVLLSVPCLGLPKNNGAGQHASERVWEDLQKRNE